MRLRHIVSKTSLTNRRPSSRGSFPFKCKFADRRKLNTQLDSGELPQVIVHFLERRRGRLHEIASATLLLFHFVVVIVVVTSVDRDLVTRGRSIRFVCLIAEQMIAVDFQAVTFFCEGLPPVVVSAEGSVYLVGARQTARSRFRRAAANQIVLNEQVSVHFHEVVLAVAGASDAVFFARRGTTRIRLWTHMVDSAQRVTHFQRVFL